MPPKNKRGNKRRQNDFSNRDDDDQGYLMIGGVRVNVSGGGNVSNIIRNNNSSSRSVRPQRNFEEEETVRPFYESDYSDEMGADQWDYLMNADDSSEYEDDYITDDQIQLFAELSKMMLADEGAVEDIIDRDEITDYSEDEELPSDGASSFSGSSDSEAYLDESQEEEEDDDDNDNIPTGSGYVPLNMKYPVQARSTAAVQHHHPTASSSIPALKNKSSSKKNSKQSSTSAVKGARNGKLAPGEKAMLRREGIKAKRASRAAARGFDLSSINKELENFVLQHHDMHAFPPYSKHECKQIQKLASLYGCKSGIQGSGKRRIVAITMTDTTSMPSDPSTLSKVKKMLAEHTAAKAGIFPTKNGGHIQTATTTRRSHFQQDQQLKQYQMNELLMDLARHHLMLEDLDDILAMQEIWDGSRNSRHKKKKNKNVSKKTKGDFFRNEYGMRKERQELKPIVFVSAGTIDPGTSNVEIIDTTATTTTTPLHAVTQDINQYSDYNNENEESMLGINAVDDADNALIIDTFALPVVVDADPFKGNRFDAMQAINRSSPGGSGSAMAPSNNNNNNGMKEERRVRKSTMKTDTITNPGRLLSLGMALGVGSEIFADPIGSDAGVPSSSQSRKLKKKELKKMKKKNMNGGEENTTSQKDENAKKKNGQYGGYAEFEKHTSGIGSRLLAKWGFDGQGTGLGRDGSGIVEPIQVEMRMKGLGLGAA